MPEAPFQSLCRLLVTAPERLLPSKGKEGRYINCDAIESTIDKHSYPGLRLPVDEEPAVVDLDLAVRFEVAVLGPPVHGAALDELRRHRDVPVELESLCHVGVVVVGGGGGSQRVPKGNGAPAFFSLHNGLEN